MSEDILAPLDDIRPIHQAAAMSIEEIVHRYLGAYESKDREMIESVIAADFTFSSPNDSYIHRDEYFEKCWAQSINVDTVLMERIFVNHDEAFVQYVIATKEGNHFRNVEFLKFEGPRIKQIDVYFGRELPGAAPLRATALSL